MLVVLAIIVLIISLATPAVTGVLKANDLTRGSEDLTNQLNLARQQALTRNRPIEVRFYQYADPASSESSSTPSSWKYRALQTFVVSETGVVTPLDKIERFPATFILDSGATLSSIIGGAQAASSGGGPGNTVGPVLHPTPQTYALPTIERDYNYISFRFYPDGSTSLGTPPSGAWFLTAHQLQYGDSLGTPPRNFATLQIDPLNGNIREFRP